MHWKGISVALFLLVLLTGLCTAADIDCVELNRVNSCADLQTPAGYPNEAESYCPLHCAYDSVLKESFICGPFGSSGECTAVSSLGCTTGTCCRIELVDAKFSFSKKYVEDTKKNRGFDPRKWGMTLFDDIVFDFKVLVCGEQGCIDRAKAMEKTGNVNIVVGDPSKKEYEKIVDLDSDSVKFLGTLPADEYGAGCKYLLYRWEDEFRGWDDGDAPGFVQTESLLETLVEEKKIKGVVKVNGKEYFSSVRRTTNCVYLNGSDGSSNKTPAKRKFFYAQDNSFKKTVAEFVGIVQDSIENSFEATEPFKSNKDKLAHYIELKKGWWKSGVDSDCENKVPGAISVEYNPDFFKGGLVVGAGLSLMANNGEIFLAGYTKGLAQTLMHEVGHTLCGLGDESKNATNGYSSSELPFEQMFLGTNCKQTGQAFGIYGANNIPGCIQEKAFIPSRFSLMNYAPMNDNRLNVISCGFCLNALNRNNSSDAFDECLNMPGVIKPGEECEQNVHCTGEDYYERPYCTFCNTTTKTCEQLGSVPCFGDFEGQPFFGYCDNGRCTPDESVQCVRETDCSGYQPYDSGCVDSCTNGTCVFSPDGKECFRDMVEGTCLGGVCQ